MTIDEASVGYYWAYYKDHGWSLIEVNILLNAKKDAYKEVYEILSGRFYSVPHVYWHNYQHLTRIEPPSKMDM